MKSGSKDNLAPEISDSFSPTIVQEDPIRKNPVGVALRDYIKNAYAMGDDAEIKYNNSLNELKKHSDEAIIEIAHSSNICNSGDYSLRWALVFAAVELTHPTSLPFFKNLILTPIPIEKPKESHSNIIAAEEIILRTTAVEGIERLAVKGNKKAADLLFEMLQNQSSLSVRRACIQGILASNKNVTSMKKKVLELLPKNQRFLCEIKRTDLKKVPQIKNPKSFLKKGSLEKESPPKIIEKHANNKAPKKKGRMT